MEQIRPEDCAPLHRPDEGNHVLQHWMWREFPSRVHEIMEEWYKCQQACVQLSNMSQDLVRRTFWTNLCIYPLADWALWDVLRMAVPPPHCPGPRRSCEWKNKEHVSGSGSSDQRIRLWNQSARPSLSIQYPEKPAGGIRGHHNVPQP